MSRFLLALTLLAFCSPAAAIEPRTAETIVLRNRIYDGEGYRDTLVPSGTPTFSLLAGSDNAVTYRQTLEYYWPLSRQLYAAFDKLDEPLAGRLRIEQNGSLLTELAPEPFAVVHPNGAGGGGAHLVWGEAAGTAVADYRREMSDYSRALAEAQADQQRYETALKDAAIARLRGGPVTAVTPPRPDPEPVRRLVGDLSTGFRVKLPAGRYDLSVISEGRLVEGSRRRLEVVAPATSSAITLDVVPEERWTRVLASSTADDAIYAAPGARFFVVPNRSDRFDERTWRSLTEPQADGRPGVPVWVRRGPATGTRLEVRGGEGSWMPLAMRNYKVRQTQGAQLGYVIEEAKAGDPGDISAYAVDVPSGAGDALALRLVEAASGAALPGSERRILKVEDGHGVLSWMAAAVPLLVGLLVVALRAARKRGALSATMPA